MGYEKITIFDPTSRFGMTVGMSSVVHKFRSSSMLITSVDVVDISRRYVTPRRTEHNLFVHVGTSEAEATNNKRLIGA